MNRDIHNLFNAYRTINENVQGKGVYTQEALNQMDIQSLNAILQKLQRREALLRELVQQSLGDQSPVML